MWVSPSTVAAAVRTASGVCPAQGTAAAARQTGSPVSDAARPLWSWASASDRRAAGTSPASSLDRS